MSDLWAALCLVAVIEGLMLFVIPNLWKSGARQMIELPTGQLRMMGGVIAGIGLAALWWVRKGG